MNLGWQENGCLGFPRQGKGVTLPALLLCSGDMGLQPGVPHGALFLPFPMVAFAAPLICRACAVIASLLICLQSGGNVTNLPAGCKPVLLLLGMQGLW